MLDSAQVKRR